VPYSLALRLVRICSEKQDLHKRFKELEAMLISRQYKKNIVKEAIEKASKLDRLEVIKKVERKSTDRVVLAVTSHPKLPSLSKIIKKHWRTMIKTQLQKKLSHYHQ
jgi:hypothetical protein